MEYVRAWWRLFVAASGWWKRLAVLLVTALALWLLAVVMVNVGVAVLMTARDLAATAAGYAARLARRSMEILPTLVLMVLLTYLMGKPGKTIRKGTVEAVNSVIVALFALIGVNLAEEKKRKRREDDDE